MKKARISLVAAMLIVFCSLGYFIFSSLNSSLLINKANSKSEELAKKIEAQITENKKTQSRLLYKKTKADPKRIVRDSDIAKRFFAPAFTWASGKEYNKIRDSYIKSLGKKDNFCIVFMPENVTVKGADGNTYDYVEIHKLNVLYDDMCVYPVSVDKDKYVYMARISYTPYKSDTNIDNISGLEKKSLIIKFTVDKNGKISDTDPFNKDIQVDAEIKK